MTGSIVVVKVGGSLLDWPGLATTLAAFLATVRDRKVVLIVGGGRFADALRDLDRVQRIGEVRSHSLSLRVLGLTAHVLADLVPGLVVVPTIADLAACWASPSTPILDPRRFLEADDRSPDPLPHAWTTTTDAIAARVATHLGALELILLKSVKPPGGAGLDELARLGLVDPEFPRAARGIARVTWVNLRDGSVPIPV